MEVRRNVYMKASVFITNSESRNQDTELPRRRLGHGLRSEQLPLANRLHDFNPGDVQRAAQNDWKPSMGRVGCFIALWSCATRVLRYCEGRITIAVLCVVL